MWETVERMSPNNKYRNRYKDTDNALSYISLYVITYNDLSGIFVIKQNIDNIIFKIPIWPSPQNASGNYFSNKRSTVTSINLSLGLRLSWDQLRKQVTVGTILHRSALQITNNTEQASCALVSRIRHDELESHEYGDPRKLHWQIKPIVSKF